MAESDVMDKSPWFGTVREGLDWILHPQTCKTEQVELVAWKASELLKAYESLDLDALCYLAAYFEPNEDVSQETLHELYAKLSAIRESA